MDIDVINVSISFSIVSESLLISCNYANSFKVYTRYIEVPPESVRICCNTIQVLLDDLEIISSV